MAIIDWQSLFQHLFGLLSTWISFGESFLPALESEIQNQKQFHEQNKHKFDGKDFGRLTYHGQDLTCYVYIFI